MHDLDFEQVTKQAQRRTDFDWMKRLMPYLQKYGTGLPMELLLGWIKKESDGSIASLTRYDERGYFQLMPDESKFFKLDHPRLSTDAEYSVAAGIEAVRFYARVVDKLGLLPADDAYWALVKLQHAIGMGAAKKTLLAARKAGVDLKSWSAISSWVVANRTALTRLLKRDPLPYIKNVEGVRVFGAKLWAEWQARSGKPSTPSTPSAPSSPAVAPSPAAPAQPAQPQVRGASTTSGVELADPANAPLIRCMQQLQYLGRPIRFVVRYLRNLTRADATALSNGGFCIVSCYEATSPETNLPASDPAYFTRAQGLADGRRAVGQAQTAGQPAGTPIYFAVDTDLPDNNASRQRIQQYLEGVRAGFTGAAVAYQIGIYGSTCVLQWAQAQGIATWFWQAFAPGWCNNGPVWANANIHTSGRDRPERCQLRLGRLEGWGQEGCWRLQPAQGQQQVPLAAPDATLPGRVINVVPAAACQVLKSGGSFKERRLGDITHVVIHVIESSGMLASSVESWRKGGGLACYKPHYAISKTGEITQIVAEKHVTAHGNGRNADSIGIEHEGWSRDPDTFTEARYLASAALVRDICRRWNIPVDRQHIDGHDNAPGTSHGDPGGYWDWDYYLALIKWDGNPATKPVRIVVDTSSSAFTAGSGWVAEDGRKAPAEQGGPLPSHSWSKKFFRAKADPKGQASRFTVTIPRSGMYEVSVWHPSLPKNNPTTPIKVDKVGYLSGTLGTRAVDQKDWKKRFRKTLALPHTPVWTKLGQLACVPGNRIVVEVGRGSAQGGQVVADAVRIFKVG